MARDSFDSFVLRIHAALREAEQDGYEPSAVLRTAVDTTTWAKSAPDEYAAVRAWPDHKREQNAPTKPADGET